MYFYNKYADTYFARFRTKYPQRKKAAALTRPAPLVTHICVIFVFDKRRSPEAALYSSITRTPCFLAYVMVFCVPPPLRSRLITTEPASTIYAFRFIIQ